MHEHRLVAYLFGWCPYHRRDHWGGTGFFFHQILSRAGNFAEAKHAHRVVGRLDKVANIGFGAVFFSGLFLGVLNPYLFQMLWFDLSMVLFFLSGIYVNTLYKKKMKQLQDFVNKSTSTEFTQEYRLLLRQKVPYEWFRMIILIAIIVLMVWKPN